MLKSATSHILRIAATHLTPVGDVEGDGVDREVDERCLEVGMIAADDLELELLTELRGTILDVVLELEAIDCDGAGTATDELGLLTALDEEDIDASAVLSRATSENSTA